VQDVLLLVAGAPDTPTICHNLLMCGRYRLSRRKQLIEEYFDSVSGEDDWNPRYNVAPTQPVPIVWGELIEACEHPNTACTPIK
jgi:hypothetical protein